MTMNEYPVINQVPQPKSTKVDWPAFWLSVGFSAVASMVWWQMLLGYGPALQGPKATGVMLYTIFIAFMAVVVTSPLAYIYAKSSMGGNVLKSLWKFIIKFLLVLVVLGVVAFFLLLRAGAGGAGGYGLLIVAVLAGAILFIFFIKAILLSILLAIPKIYRKRVQYILLIVIALIYAAQVFGYGRFGLIE